MEEKQSSVSAVKETNFIEKAKAIAIRDSIYIGIPIHVIPEENSNGNPENKITWISPKGEILFTYHKAKPTYPGECDSGDGVIKYLKEKGVECKPYFTPIHLQPFYVDMFGYKRGDFPITEDVSSRTIALPFFNNLQEEQIDYVVEKVREGIKISR